MGYLTKTERDWADTLVRPLTIFQASPRNQAGFGLAATGADQSESVGGLKPHFISDLVPEIESRWRKQEEANRTHYQQDHLDNRAVPDLWCWWPDR